MSFWTSGGGPGRAGLPHGIENHAGGNGIEDKGGCGRVREMEGADNLDGVALLGEAVDEHGALLRRERDGGDAFGGFDHRGGDLRQGLGIDLRGMEIARSGLHAGLCGGEGQEGAGQQGVREPRGGARGEQPTTRRRGGSR